MQAAIWAFTDILVLVKHVSLNNYRLDRRLITAKLRHCGDLDVQNGLSTLFDVHVTEVIIYILTSY